MSRQSIIALVALCLLTLLIVCTVSLSQLYDGDADIGEIIFGLGLGVWFAVIMQLLVKDTLKKHVYKLYDGLYINKYKYLLTIFTVMVVSFEILMLVTFLIVDSSF